MLVENSVSHVQNRGIENRRRDPEDASPEGMNRFPRVMFAGGDIGDCASCNSTPSGSSEYLSFGEALKELAVETVKFWVTGENKYTKKEPKEKKPKGKKEKQKKSNIFGSL